MSNRVLKKVPESDAQRVLDEITSCTLVDGKTLVTSPWSSSKGFGYCVRSIDDHTRVAAFMVAPISSRISVWMGFENEFEENSWMPLIGIENVSQFEAEYRYNEREIAARTILNWIFNSRLEGFVPQGKPEPIQVPVMAAEEAVYDEDIPYVEKPVQEIKEPEKEFPVPYKAERPIRHYAVGKRKRNNKIFELLELAEEGVVAYEALQEWFFGKHSARETVRRLKRVARYGFTLHLVPYNQDDFQGWKISFNASNRKLIDLKLVISREHALRLKNVWHINDGDYNPDCERFILSHYHNGEMLYVANNLKWTDDKQKAAMCYRAASNEFLKEFPEGISELAPKELWDNQWKFIVNFGPYIDVYKKFNKYD